MMGLQKSGVTYDYLEEFVLEYGAVREEQILRLYEVMGVAPKTANQHLKVFKNFITRCRYDRNTNIFYANGYGRYNEISPSFAHEMELCLWVAIEFVSKVELLFPVSPHLSPSRIALILEDRTYEIVYCSQDSAPFLDNLLRAVRLQMIYQANSEYFSKVTETGDAKVLESVKYIVLLEDLESARHIHAKNVAYFVTLDEQNICTFYAAEDIRNVMRTDGRYPD